MDRSRLPEFYKLAISDRLTMLHERRFFSERDYRALASGGQLLSPAAADHMIENVIGVFGLPLGVGLNFLVNGKDYVVPLVVEEPSILAALSAAAKLMRQAGGFTCESTEPILVGQVQVVDVPDMEKAKAALREAKDEVLRAANALHPKMVARGGGAKDLELFTHPRLAAPGEMLVVHLLVDTRDAMGANLVNTMCEGVASLIEKLTGGKVFLRILSNLSDRALARARVTVPAELLASKGYSGEAVRDGIVLANDFALVDPYRAATHNKGIMNGIDPVAIATGNDWRAIEAAAHAYAARSGRYQALTRWEKDAQGRLTGFLEVPLKVGVVGGSLESNPAVGIALRLLDVGSARELAEVMAAVGLAQNFSALRALATSGIQAGHMSLHARSVAATAGATAAEFEAVVAQLIEGGEIKVWKAQEILAQLRAGGTAAKSTIDVRRAPASRSTSTSTSTTTTTTSAATVGAGHGKIILLGEHAVVHGSHAIAAPVPLAIQAKVESSDRDGVHVLIPPWGIEEQLDPAAAPRHSLHQSLALILERLDLSRRRIRLEITPQVPRAMGLGGSAALAVAVIRALSGHFEVALDDAQVNELAFACERVAHGTPSGVDNTLATYGKFILFKRGEPPLMRELRPAQPLPIVIGITGVEGLTSRTVEAVRLAHARNPTLYDRIFAEIDTLTLQAVGAIEQGRLAELGELMNVCQGLLNALQVSCAELEELIHIARHAGAVGAKLTGGGGGGSMIALCSENAEGVAAAMRRAGYRAMVAQIG